MIYALTVRLCLSVFIFTAEEEFTAVYDTISIPCCDCQLLSSNIVLFYPDVLSNYTIVAGKLNNQFDYRADSLDCIGI